MMSSEPMSFLFLNSLAMGVLSIAAFTALIMIAVQEIRQRRMRSLPDTEDQMDDEVLPRYAPPAYSAGCCPTCGHAPAYVNDVQMADEKTDER